MKEPAKSKAKNLAQPKKGYRESASSETIAHSYISGATFGLKKVTYAVVDGMAVFEGDIILGSAKEMEDVRNSVENPDPDLEMAVILPGTGQVRWPDGIMPFVVDPALPNQQRVADAINHIHANTNLRLVARTNHADFVNFTNGAGCSSPVGRRGGQQNITLGTGCDWPRAVHEICHSAGLWHEQSREDRDSFVTIHFDNIPQNRKNNFDQHISDGDDFGPYDYDSLMHYGRRDFAIDTTKDTVTPKPDPNRAIGQRTGLSLGDISAVNFLYPRKATLGDTSSNGPALARRDGKLLLGWTGTGNLRLNFMSSTDGLNFTDKVTLGDLSPNGLALTVFNGSYFVAWTGVGNNQLNVMRSANGVNWDNKVTLADTSLSSPALGVLGNRLCIAWRGVGNNQLNVMQSGDGITWQNKVTLGDTTTSGPALATLGPRLLIGWRGVGNNQLNVMPSANGVSFSGKVTLGETTVSRPHLLVRGNRAFLSWQGVGNRFLNILSSADGAAWVNKFTSRETCIDGPALSELGNNLVWGWTGTNAAHNLNTTLFNWA
jgi:Astacin (Peptidase family M12A)